ncbi:conserved hypothetical protein [Ricinus communis]|uniref:Uncharacterized protein n=1 Tax=Ricinus communis TaxID=3988 RepID=B9T665_RICCO|nr:conserved hypothetical protein [Ricinus communis]
MNVTYQVFLDKDQQLHSHLECDSLLIYGTSCSKGRWLSATQQPSGNQLEGSDLGRSKTSKVSNNIALEAPSLEFSLGRTDWQSNNMIE